MTYTIRLPTRITAGAGIGFILVVSPVFSYFGAVLSCNNRPWAGIFIIAPFIAPNCIFGFIIFIIGILLMFVILFYPFRVAFASLLPVLSALLAVALELAVALPPVAVALELAVVAELASLETKQLGQLSTGITIWHSPVD